MNDYIILQNMLELAQQLGDAASKEILVKTVSKSLNVNQYHRDLQREVLIDTQHTIDYIDISKLMEF